MDPYALVYSVQSKHPSTVPRKCNQIQLSGLECPLIRGQFCVAVLRLRALLLVLAELAHGGRRNASAAATGGRKCAGAFLRTASALRLSASDAACEAFNDSLTELFQAHEALELCVVAVA